MGKGDCPNDWNRLKCIKYRRFSGAKPNLELLIKGRADVNIPDMNNETPLHKSLQHGNFSDYKPTFIKQIKKKSTSCLKIKRKSYGCYLKMVLTLMRPKFEARRHYIWLLKMVIEIVSQYTSWAVSIECTFNEMIRFGRSCCSVTRI